MSNVIAAGPVDDPQSASSRRDTGDDHDSPPPKISLDSWTDDSPSMLSEVIDSIVVVAHGRSAPRQSEWDRMHELIETEDSVRGCVITGHPECPGPNARQRRQGRTAWQRRKRARLAVITNSTKQRGIVMGFHWFLGNRMLAFTSSRWRDAMNHVEIGLDTQKRILEWLDRAIRVLDGPEAYTAVGIEPGKWRTQLVAHSANEQGTDSPVDPAAQTDDGRPEIGSLRPQTPESAKASTDPQPSKRMATCLLGRDNLLLMVHAHRPPSDEEWNDHVTSMAALFQRRIHRSVYCLIYSLGGVPSPKQRAAVLKITPPEARARIALLTDPQAARAAPESHAWIRGAKMQVFGLDELERALRWLGIKSFSAPAIEDEIVEMIESTKTTGVDT